MKLLIGVFQERKQLDNYLDSFGIERNEIVQVGPFASRSQALRWMEHMKNKLKPANVGDYVVGCLYPNIWYGAVFEADNVVGSEEPKRHGKSRAGRSGKIEPRIMFPG